MVDLTVLEKKVQQSIDILKNRSIISKLLIGVSGGKDSLVMCELIKMAGIMNVEYFNMEFLPNLRIQKELLEYLCIRFNIPYESIIKTPSEHFYRSMSYSAYTWYSKKAKKHFPKISRTQICRKIAQEHKGTIVMGVKKCDSIMMSRTIKANKGVYLYPLKDWTTDEIFTFMKLRNIKVPELIKKGCRGIGLTDESIYFINENYPDDMQKIERIFPFAKVMIYKYQYFNLERTMRIV